MQIAWRRGFFRLWVVLAVVWVAVVSWQQYPLMQWGINIRTSGDCWERFAHWPDGKAFQWWDIDPDHPPNDSPVAQAAPAAKGGNPWDDYPAQPPVQRPAPAQAAPAQAAPADYNPWDNYPAPGAAPRSAPAAAAPAQPAPADSTPWDSDPPYQGPPAQRPAPAAKGGSLWGSYQEYTGEQSDRDRWRDAAVEKIRDCEAAGLPITRRIKRMIEDNWAGVGSSLALILFPPLALLGLGGIFRWVVAGFRPSSS